MRRHHFKELNVWQRAKDLTVNIYQITQHFPKVEQYGLNQQIRKSAVSIASNIAEGCGRGTDKQLVQFLNFAQGSAFELETQVIIASELNYLTDKDTKTLKLEISEIQRMIDGFSSRFE